MTDRFRCSDAARAHGDGIAGSAGTAVGWLLIEHPGPWAPDAAATIPGPVGRDLATLTARRRVRPLLIRRPGRPAAGDAARALMLVDQATRRAWRGDWRRPEDLAAALRLIGRPLPDPAPPVVLVCTHGKHDQCCAIRGRPVAQALAAGLADSVWECTHLGGDRFAPNVMVLPDGAVYAAGDPATAVRVVADHLAGRPTPDRLRGISGPPPPAQAALVQALRDHPGSGPADHSVLEVTAAGPDAWRVRLLHRARGQEESTVLVRAQAGPARRLTCRAAEDGIPLSYRVVDEDAG